MPEVPGAGGRARLSPNAMVHGLVRLLGALGLFLVLAWGLIVGYMALNESSYIFRPTTSVEEGLNPGRVGLAWEDLWIRLHDDAKVHAWWLPGPGGPDAPVVLYFHGNGGYLGGRLGVLKALLSLDAPLGGILAPDYPGYGESTGSPSEAGCYETARRCYAVLREDRGVPPRRIVVFGRSLGAAVALHAAVEKPCAGLVMGVPFLSVPRLAREYYPWIPGLGLFVRQRFDNEQTISRLQAPLLLIQAPRDTEVPPEHAWRLYGLARKPAWLVTIPGAGHNDTYSTAPGVWKEAWTSFLERLGLGDHPEDDAGRVPDGILE